MAAIRRLRQRVRSVWYRARFERDLDLELQFHLDMQTAQNIGRGMPAEIARRTAHQVFGPVAGVKDDVRDTWLSGLLATAGQDLRYGLRILFGAPTFAVGIILTIALAVGVNTPIFAVAHAILLKELPFERPHALVVLQHTLPNRGTIKAFSNREMHDYRRVSGLDSIAELHTMWFILLGGSTPERVSTGVVSTNYFDLLGVRPLLGRAFLPSDDDDREGAVLLLTHDYWRRSLGADPAIVGRTFEMNDRVHTVIGVLPPFPQYPQTVDVYMPTAACPFRSRPSVAEGRSMRMGRLIARTHGGVSRAQLEAGLGEMASHLRHTYPEVYGSPDASDPAHAAYRVEAIPLAEEMRAVLRPRLWLLVATAGLVLMIGCVSVSNLTLARLTHRAGEISLRAALGATRGRLLRQLLTEHLSVVLLGSLSGLVLGQLAVMGLTAHVQWGTTLPVPSSLTAPAIVYAIAASIVLLFVCCAVPVLARPRVFDADLPRQQPGRIRCGLVVGQVSLSFVLMIAAVLSVRSLVHLQGIDTGFSTEHVQTMRLDLNFTKYHDYPSISGFWREFERALTAVPAISEAGGAGMVPLDGRPLSSSPFELEAGGDDDRSSSDGVARTRGAGEPRERSGERGVPASERVVGAGGAKPPGEEETPRANLRVASPGYFGALGQRVLHGRTFTTADAGKDALVIVVNESLARKHWPPERAVGQRLRVASRSAEVIGVVEDTRQALEQAPSDEIYLPVFVTTQLSMNWLVRSYLLPEDVERRVRAIVRAIDPEQPVDNFRSLESFRADSLLPSRVTAGVISSFSVLALIITATGIAGVIGFGAQQRRHEFGVRLALGARRSRVLSLVIGEALRLACVGLAIGALGSVVLFPFVRNVLRGVDTFDASPLALVSGVLLAVAAAAAFIPARRAARVDPMIVLRES